MKNSIAPVQAIIGRCLCKQVEYEVQDRFAYVGFCHCRDCQQQTGSAFTFIGAVAESDLHVTRGQDRLAEYRKSEETLLNFCSCCGSQLFARKPLRQSFHVRIGSLERPPTCLPMAHVFYASRMPGVVIDDGLPRFNGLPPAAVIAQARLAQTPGMALPVQPVEA